MSSSPCGESGCGIGGGKLPRVVITLYGSWHDGTVASGAGNITRVAHGTVCAVTCGLGTSNTTILSGTCSHHGLVAHKARARCFWRCHIHVTGLRHRRVVLNISHRPGIVHIPNLRVTIRGPLLRLLLPLLWPLLGLTRSGTRRNCSRCHGARWQASFKASITVVQTLKALGA